MCTTGTINSGPVTPPPSVLTIYLRLRFRADTMQWTFFREANVQYQLDNALQTYTSCSAHQFHDAVGIIVNGRLYVDDEPFWRNLLVSGATYHVAYLRRPFWYSPWTRVRDSVAGTPLVDVVPGRALRFTTRHAYAALLADGGVTGTERTCQHGRRYARFCNPRGGEQMEEAWREGRMVDWERILLLRELGTD